LKLAILTAALDAALDQRQEIRILVPKSQCLNEDIRTPIRKGHVSKIEDVVNRPEF